MPIWSHSNLPKLRSSSAARGLCQHHLFLERPDLLLNKLPQRLKGMEFSVDITASQPPGRTVNTREN